MRFVVSGNLLRFTSFTKEIDVGGSTLGEGFAALFQCHPQLEPIVRDAEGNIRGLHQIFVNGEHVRKVAGEREVGPDDEIMVITALAGG